MRLEFRVNLSAVVLQDNVSRRELHVITTAAERIYALSAGDIAALFIVDVEPLQYGSVYVVDFNQSGVASEAADPVGFPLYLPEADEMGPTKPIVMSVQFVQAYDDVEAEPVAAAAAMSAAPGDAKSAHKHRERERERERERGDRLTRLGGTLNTSPAIVAIKSR